MMNLLIQWMSVHTTACEAVHAVTHHGSDTTVARTAGVQQGEL